MTVLGDEEKQTVAGALSTGDRPEPGAAFAQLLRRGLVKVSKQVLLSGFTARFARLERKARPVYLRLRIMNLLGPAQIARRKVPGSARSFLAVCFGNIMRSPMVELMLWRALSEQGFTTARVESGGLHAVPGRAAHPWAIEVSRELGIPLDDHRAKLVTPEMVERADVIFAMDFENLAELLARYPQASEKVYMLGAYAEGTQQYREIPDPYFGDVAETRRCYGTLQTCVGRLVASLEQGKVYGSMDPNR